MNNPPNVPPAPKKGLTGLAIAGFGCGGLVIAILIVGCILVVKGCNKVKELANDISTDPGKAAVMALDWHPELEVVSTDDAKREATIKIKKTGETYTMSFDDIANGKIAMRDAKGQEISMDMSKADTEGKVVIKGRDGAETVIDGTNGGPGKMTFKSGTGEEVVIGTPNLQDLPAWVPIYPGANAREGGGGSMKSENNGILTGAVALQSTDAVAKIKEYYDGKLKETGYKIEVNEITTGTKQTVILNGTKTDNDTLNIVIRGEDDGKTAIMVNYNGPK